MPDKDKPLLWLKGSVQTPPFSRKARLEAGFLLRKLQKGEFISLPDSRPMPVIGKHCHELRIADQRKSWRIVYRIDDEAVVILEVFEKKTSKTPQYIINSCRERLKRYDHESI
jgi:phage-related protein